MNRKLPLLLLPLLLAGCSQNLSLTNQTFVMELGTDVFANPSLYLENPEQVNVSRLQVVPRSPGITVTDNRFVSVSLDYLGVGEYDFVMKDGDQEIPFVIKIKDTKAPSIKNAPASIEAAWTSDIDWASIIQADDISGVYYDVPSNITDTPGEKDVDVKIRDRFGNSTTRTVHVVVK